MIKAIALLERKGYNTRLLVCGSVGEEKALKALVKKLNLVEKVVFLGWIEDKNKFFDQVDIFRLPSTFSNYLA